MKRKKSALVMLSGGLDSATCLAVAYKSGWSLDYQMFKNLFTVSFDYGQKHKRELQYAEYLSKKAGALQHFEVPLPSLAFVSKSSSLVNNDIDTSAYHPINKNLPSSFLPNRNFVMFGLAASLGYELGATNIFSGVCQTDYDGYPDCRNKTIEAIEEALSLSLNEKFSIHTPLMYKTKAQTIQLMQSLDLLDWYAHTHTCYEGKRPPCGKCPACLVRAEGFKEAGLDDPLTVSEQKLSLFEKGIL